MKEMFGNDDGGGGKVIEVEGVGEGAGVINEQNLFNVSSTSR